jgi:hypothetical protein
MLTYHPAFDIYHGVFRLLRILTIAPKQQFEIERIRILDFYVLFPNELHKFRFPQSLRSKRKGFNRDNPYQRINDTKRIFYRLEPYQICSIKCLVARQFIDYNLFLEGKIARTEKPLPEGLENAIVEANKKSTALIEFFNESLLKIDLYGGGGLKGRSDLFEYRYDVTNTTTSP